MKKLASGVSTVFHPVFLPFMACYWLISQDFFFIREDLKPLIIKSIFIVALAIPLVSVFILKRIGLVSSIRIPNVKERRIPYYITFLSFLLLGLFFRNNIYIPWELSMIFLSCSISMLILIALIPITKASAHLACLGGIIGALYVLTTYLNYGFFYPIILLFILSGFVGWSRLKLKAHSPQQLLTGCTVGFSSQLIGYIFYNQINAILDSITI